MEEFADEGETPYGIMQAQALSVSDEFVSNRKVCVVDSGYDINHPDLQNDYVTGTEGGAGMWSEPKDSHGTHCAGTIAAVGNNDGVRGVVRSGKMNLHIVRIFNDEGNWAWSSSLVNAVSPSSSYKIMFYLYIILLITYLLFPRFKHVLMLSQMS